MCTSSADFFCLFPSLSRSIPNTSSIWYNTSYSEHIISSMIYSLHSTYHMICISTCAEGGARLDSWRWPNNTNEYLYNSIYTSTKSAWYLFVKSSDEHLYYTAAALTKLSVLLLVEGICITRSIYVWSVETCASISMHVRMPCGNECTAAGWISLRGVHQVHDYFSCGSTSLLAPLSCCRGNSAAFAWRRQSVFEFRSVRICAPVWFIYQREDRLHQYDTRFVSIFSAPLTKTTKGKLVWFDSPAVRTSIWIFSALFGDAKKKNVGLIHLFFVDRKKSANVQKKWRQHGAPSKEG